LPSSLDRETGGVCGQAASPRAFLMTLSRFFRSLVSHISCPSIRDGAAKALDGWKNWRDADHIARASVKSVIWLRAVKVADYSVRNCTVSIQQIRKFYI